VLSGWLYKTTRLTAANFLRGEIRRQQREQEAFMQSTLQEPADDLAWRQIAPLLDEALGKLGDRDRNAILLRFFEGKSLAEVGAAAGTSEDAAKMRVNRALEKLRKIFGKRGAAFSVVAIAGAVSANSVHAAPVGLAKAVSALALTKGAAAGGSTLTLAKGALKLMAWSKTQTAIVAGVVVLFAAGTTTVTVKEIHEHQNDEWQLGEISEKLLLKPPFRTVILPTKIADKRRQNRTPGTISMADGRAVGINSSLENILRWAYSPAQGEEGGEYYELSPARIVLDTTLATNRYDYFSNQPKGSRNALQHEIKRKFGLVARFETIETNVLILKFKPENYGKLKLSSGKLPSRTEISNGAVSAGGQTAEDFTRTLETSYFFFPVINQTGLTNKYDFEASWDSTDPVHSRSNLEQALTDQIGLEVIPTNLPVEMLIVTKATD
ncbi:MAG: sigma-70 family RNA polymerase sigma factor, partial [Verrucomicrobiota bacterium]